MASTDGTRADGVGTTSQGGNSVPPVIERFIRQLVIANQAVSLYPSGSSIPRDAAATAAAVLYEALRDTAEIRFVVTKDGMLYNDMPVLGSYATFVGFARQLYHHMLSEFRFHAGAQLSDIIAFLLIANEEPAELTASGGFENRLWQQNISAITVIETKVMLVDAEAPEDFESEVSLTTAEIDELVASARRGSSRDQIAIGRFIGNAEAVRCYLSDVLTNGGESGFDRMVGSFWRLAQLAANAVGEERDEQMRSLAEAALDLAEGIRRDLVAEHLLPEARRSEPLASVVRQMDIEEICRMFASSEGTAATYRQAMVRAIRNLNAITGIASGDIAFATTNVLHEQGVDAEEITSVLEEAMPSRLTVRDESASRAVRPADAVLALIDSAPGPSEVDSNSIEIFELKEEARRGVTDADVINTLVTLVTLDTREEQFMALMTRLEDALDLLIQRGELEVAAEVTATLGTAAKDPSLSPEQRDRLVRSIARFARASDVRSLVQALRLYPTDSQEHRSALRLIRMLGPLAIKPLLEHLAEEPDMSMRKSLVDIISIIAQQYIPDLGEQVTDQRWYFVRNVVSILGSTKSSAIIPYLERTLRHSDARVRRETIRALSMLNDPLASQMLVHSLYDADGQNVQLAARYIGEKGIPGAIPTLEQVVRGEGRGNRDVAPRIEAIETLGKLGATEVLPTLRMLSGRRGILGGTKARELRAAAVSAVERIEGGGGAQ
jgi:HEAT repeat protein